MRVSMAILLFIVLGAQSDSKAMRLTIYDDRRSCPGNCDSHVVVHRRDNGTRYVSLPASSRANPRPCVSGQACRTCFGDSNNSCMTAMYGGRGLNTSIGVAA